MASFEIQLKRIQEKTQQLVKQYQLLKTENKELKKEVQQSTEKLEIYKNKMEHLEEKVAVLKMSTGQLNEADKKEVVKRLNQYLKEIDRCISVLSE